MRSATRYISLLTLLSTTTWTCYIWPRRGHKARTPSLQLLSHLAAICLSMLLRVISVTMMSVFFSELHTLSTTRYFARFVIWMPRSTTLTGAPLHYDCSSSIDRHRPVPTPSRSSPSSSSVETSSNASERSLVSSPLVTSMCGTATTEIRTHELFTTSWRTPT